jgi:Protein of unknown function (DUF3570)
VQLKFAIAPSANGTGHIGKSLAAATCALLGTHLPGTVVAQEIGQWKVDTAGLYYSEADNRVKDLSFSLFARTQPLEDNFLNLTFTFDTLSGASPNGAAPSSSPQTFARPITLTRSSGGGVTSSGGNFTIAAGDLPVDPSFKDTRFAGSADWQRPFGRLTLADFGASVSTEHDYKHLGVNTGIARDFNDRNTTLSAGLAWSDDKVQPVGGSPIPFTAMTPDAGGGGGGGDGLGEASLAKHVSDTLLGLTQVINRHTIAQFNYSVSRSDGYLTDPYKLISVVDPVTGDVAPGPAGLGFYRYENRPDSREKRSLFGLLKRDFGGDVLDASYRVMTDDWGVHSRTFDLHYRWDLGSSSFVQPHLRLYSQTAADFYHTVLLYGAPLPAFATADYRLGQFDAVTVGFKYGKKTRSGEFSARVELYRQSGSPSPDALVGSLRGVNLTPDLTALIAQLSYKFDF